VAHDPFEVLNLAQVGLVSGGLGNDPGRQQRKQDFVSQQPDTSIYNPHRLETPISPWQVMAGTVIPATLLTGINSDLPGQVIAQVTEPIYDTVTGNAVLIPQGSRVVGRYDNVIAYGQSRALIVWHRIIMPNGTSIRIENLPAVDGRGNAGLIDRVDNHTLRIFSAAALSSLISIGAELGDDDDTIARALRDATQDGASRVGEEVVRRQLSVQPTITIRPGWRLRILVHQDIILQPYGDQ
jgi:type IV secretion system protein VirB10